MKIKLEGIQERKKHNRKCLIRDIENGYIHFFNDEKKLQRKLYETQRTNTQLIEVPAEENQRQQNNENIIQ